MNTLARAPEWRAIRYSRAYLNFVYLNVFVVSHWRAVRSFPYTHHTLQSSCGALHDMCGKSSRTAMCAYTHMSCVLLESKQSRFASRPCCPIGLLEFLVRHWKRGCQIALRLDCIVWQKYVYPNKLLFVGFVLVFRRSFVLFSHLVKLFFFIRHVGRRGNDLQEAAKNDSVWIAGD